MGWFKKQKPALPVLKFKSGSDFIDYHCKYMATPLEAGTPLAAIVLDARKSFGTNAPIKTDQHGIQTASLRVASDDGGFIVLAETASKGAALEPGDVVAWIPGEYVPLIAKGSKDPRFGWMGLIVAKVAPEIDMAKGQMTVIARY